MLGTIRDRLKLGTIVSMMESKGEVIKHVERFSYLGSFLTSNGRCDTEIKRRTGIATKSLKDLVIF